MGLPKWLSDKESTHQAGDVGLILGWQDPLEKKIATHSSVLGWKISWTKQPDRLQSVEPQKSRTPLRDKTMPNSLVCYHVLWAGLRCVRSQLCSSLSAPLTWSVERIFPQVEMAPDFPSILSVVTVRERENEPLHLLKEFPQQFRLKSLTNCCFGSAASMATFG